MEKKDKAGPGAKSGMTNDGERDRTPSTASRSPSPSRGGSKPPRWTIAFLRSLERTGSPEAAALDAGIDRTTAYHRRKAHPDFGEAWEEALRVRSGREQAEVRERVSFWEKVKGKVTPKMLSGEKPSPGSPKASPTAAGSHRPPDGALPGAPACGRGELYASTSLGGKVVRVGPGRWSAAKERRFFEELAASANVTAAAAAAGVSTNAVYARRLNRADFRAKWQAVLDTGRAAIEMHLVEVGKKSFDPKALALGEVQPKVSVTEALRIVQLNGNKSQRQDAQPAAPSDEDIEAVRQRLFDKLQRLRKRQMPRMLKEGWSQDEATGSMVPPGWVRAQAAK